MGRRLNRNDLKSKINSAFRHFLLLLNLGLMQLQSVAECFYIHFKLDWTRQLNLRYSYQNRWKQQQSSRSLRNTVKQFQRKRNHLYSKRKRSTWTTWLKRISLKNLNKHLFRRLLPTRTLSQTRTIQTLNRHITSEHLPCRSRSSPSRLTSHPSTNHPFSRFSRIHSTHLIPRISRLRNHHQIHSHPHLWTPPPSPPLCPLSTQQRYSPHTC